MEPTGGGERVGQNEAKAALCSVLVAVNPAKAWQLETEMGKNDPPAPSSLALVAMWDCPPLEAEEQSG